MLTTVGVILFAEKIVEIVTVVAPVNGIFTVEQYVVFFQCVGRRRNVHFL